MKKLAIGCLVVVLVVGVAVIGIGYYGYLKVKDTVSQLAELQKVPEIERGIRVKTPFTVPASGELTAAQVDRFMTVSTRARAPGPGHGGVRAQLQDARGQEGLHGRRHARPAGGLSRHGDRVAHREARTGRRPERGRPWLEEYRWIRSEAYRALGVPFVDVDFARIAEQAQSGKQPSAPMMVGGAFTGPGPDANMKLVERHRKQLEDYVPLASFGL